jgi:hypothetical protein
MLCIISGCKNQADNVFGVRLRNPDTNAIWAPNTAALICDQHAISGIKVTVLLEETSDKKVTTTVRNTNGLTRVKTMKITKSP